MHTISTNDKVRFRALLACIKIYTVLGPLVVVALIRGLALDGDVAVHWVVAGYFLSFLVLLFAGISQLSSGLRKAAHSSFIYAGVALFWICVALFLLPRLAST
jgi:hypothetical protein